MDISLRRPVISMEIYTEHAEFQIVDDTSQTPTNAQITSRILSFETDNDLSADSAAFSILLAGDINWDSLLNPNDLIILRINPNGVDNQDTTANRDNGSYNDNIMTGVLSSVQSSSDYDKSMMSFQLSGKSIAKIFQQYKIGVIQEAQAILSSMGWLWDTNADLTAMAVSTSTDDSGGDDPDDSTNTSNFSGNSVAMQLANHLSSEGFNKKHIAAFLGSTQQESGFQLTVNAADSYGLFQSHPASKVQNWCKQHGYDYKTVKGQMAWFETAYSYSGNTLADFKKQSGTIDELTTWMRSSLEGGTVGNSKTYAQQWYSKIKNKDLSASDGSSDDGSDSSSSTSVDITGTVNATASSISHQKAVSQGVAFWGNNVSVIEAEVLARFMKYIHITWDGYKPVHFLKADNFYSWDEYEYMQDSNQFTSFSGSLAGLQDALLVKPFNELYYEFLEDGRSELVIRRSPFNPEDWDQLPEVDISKGAIMSLDIGRSDDEAYSIFSCDPTILSSLNLTNSGTFGASPQYHPSLVDIYGYRALKVTSPYLGVTAGSDPENEVDNSVDRALRGETVGQTTQDITGLNQDVGKGNVMVNVPDDQDYTDSALDNTEE